MKRTERDIRAFLIAEADRFIVRAVSSPGVRKIAIVGSLTTVKADPKDADILVTVDDDADLTALATAARKLKGAAQTRNKGADIFLANPRSEYSAASAIGESVAQALAFPVMPNTVEVGTISTTILMMSLSTRFW